jgi:hypothetical protein
MNYHLANTESKNSFLKLVGIMGTTEQLNVRWQGCDDASTDADFDNALDNLEYWAENTSLEDIR